MAAASNDFEPARTAGNFVAVRNTMRRRGQVGYSLYVILAAPEQFVGQILVHAVTSKEQALRFSAFFGAAVLMIDRLQIFDLRHDERTVETLGDPSGQAHVIGV